MVCKDDYETRNIADFYQTPDDSHKLPWTRPDAGNIETSWISSNSGFVWASKAGGAFDPNTFILPAPTWYRVDTVNRIVTYSIQFIFAIPGSIWSLGTTNLTVPAAYLPTPTLPAGLVTSNGKILGKLTGSNMAPASVDCLTILPVTTTNLVFSGQYGY